MKLAPAIYGLKPEGAYAVLSKCEELERKGKNIIHFEIGQPDFPTPKHISEAGIDAIRKGLTRYTAPLGIMPLRQAIAASISETRNIDISPNQIAVTPSGKTAIYTAMALTIAPGDEVIYPDPCFPVYEVMTEYLGGIKKPEPLLEKNSFRFDMKVFEKQFSKKTKLIILNSPSNPTGGVIPIEDLKKIADMVRGTDCWIMTDEIYARILYTGKEYPSFYGLKGVRERTLLVDALSKTYSMTGWRIGYIAAPEKIMKYVDYFLTHTIACTATFTQYAAIAAFTGPQGSINAMTQEFRKRRDYVVSRLNGMKGVTCIEPQGAFYAFPNIKSFGKKSKEIADHLLKKAGVAVLDGTAFGKYGEGYLRISYATSMDKLKEGLDRMEKGLADL